MRILCLAEDSHEISSLIFSENNEKILKVKVVVNQGFAESACIHKIYDGKNVRSFGTFSVQNLIFYLQKKKNGNAFACGIFEDSFLLVNFEHPCPDVQSNLNDVFLLEGKNPILQLKT